jgi:hypothetical protein
MGHKDVDDAEKRRLKEEKIRKLTPEQLEKNLEGRKQRIREWRGRKLIMNIRWPR